jgi:hypothetical protein
VEIAAKDIQFHLVSPEEEKRSGLYACSLLAGQGIEYSFREIFTACADGRWGGRILKPRADRQVVLVGRADRLGRNPEASQYPYPYNSESILIAEPGTICIADGEITIPVKNIGLGCPSDKAKGEPKVAYMTAILPPLPAGKYRASIVESGYL